MRVAAKLRYCTQFYFVLLEFAFSAIRRTKLCFDKISSEHESLSG